MCTCFVVCICSLVQYMGTCVLCSANAYVRVHMCLWYCWYHSHGSHQSLTDMGQMFSSVPVDINKSKQLEEETSEKRIRAKQPSGHYLCRETCPAGRKSMSFCEYLCNKALHTPGGFCPSPSLLEMAVRTKSGSRTLQWSHSASFQSKKCLVVGEEEGEEALGVAWTINSP